MTPATSACHAADAIPRATRCMRAARLLDRRSHELVSAIPVFGAQREQLWRGSSWRWFLWGPNSIVKSPSHIRSRLKLALMLIKQRDALVRRLLARINEPRPFELH